MRRTTINVVRIDHMRSRGRVVDMTIDTTKRCDGKNGISLLVGGRFNSSLAIETIIVRRVLRVPRERTRPIPSRRPPYEDGWCLATLLVAECDN